MNKEMFREAGVSLTLEKVSGESGYRVNINANSEGAIVWALAALPREAESVTDVPARKLLEALKAQASEK